MTTQIATLNTANFAEMAQAMGMGADMNKGPAKSSTLPRLRIWNQAVMGQVDVKGKLKNMEVVPAGMYRMQMPDESCIYAEEVDIRVFVQRFMYKRYDSEAGQYVKTLMAEDLNGDLKDNTGGFNCGKSAGYIEDYNSLPDDTKALMKQIKRVRVLLGEVKLVNAVDGEGNEMTTDALPFIWEVENRDAFKTMGEPFAQLGRQKRLPVQHWIRCGTEEQTLKTGASFFLPTQKLDLSTTIDLTEDDQTRFSDFIEWIGNYNQYIVNAYNENSGKQRMSADDESLIEEFIDIDEE